MPPPSSSAPAPAGDRQATAALGLAFAAGAVVGLALGVARARKGGKTRVAFVDPRANDRQGEKEMRERVRALVKSYPDFPKVRP